MKETLFASAHAEALYNDLRRANTEQAKKERFLQYLTKTFSRDSSAQALISAMALGAERTIANVTRHGRMAKGRADSQTETIIIEWEQDLSRTGEHAREQLAEYLEGSWRSGQEYRFVLIATDGIRWRRYAPSWSSLDFRKSALGRNFDLREIGRFDLMPETFDEFPFFLDSILFTSKLKIATLENIQNDFGDTSATFINSATSLQACTVDIKRRSELKVAFEQWRRFLSIAYGKFDDSPTMFLLHTYLSVFAKFIAYSVVTKKPISNEGTIRDILSGEIFIQLNVERFVEDDFFHWVVNRKYFSILRPMFRALTAQLHQYDFSEVREDILKGVYQELIDRETKHALGEYYTPDWLCERILTDLKVEEESSFLDPACGSGSFLRAAISRLKEVSPKIGAEALADQVVGIDIHPLSVLIAKTTILLALGTAVTKAPRPVTLQVYLANSLLVPRGSADLFATNFQIAVDGGDYTLDVKGIDDSDGFDRLITFCDDMVTRNRAHISRERFEQMLQHDLPKRGAKKLPEQLYSIYHAMKDAHLNGRDSIWKFILQNSYKPVFLMNKFDFVIGNPPWLTYADVPNGEYQSLLRGLSQGYGVTPQSKANMPHLEIAAIFLAHSVNYFLKSHGRLAFVLPRSFLSADHHDNTRTGRVSGIKLAKIWDLREVEPLFRVPSCVVFATRCDGEQADREVAPTGLAGRAFKGRLPRFQIHWAEAKRALHETSQSWYVSQLHGGRGAVRSAFTNRLVPPLKGGNAYETRFTQGATIVPRNFFFIRQTQDDATMANIQNRVIPIRTSEASEREAKAPWKGEILSGRVEGRLLFRTAISRNIIPFALVEPVLVVLPVVVRARKGSDAKFEMLSSDELRAAGFRYGSAWFYDAERRWERKRTDINKRNGVSLSDYVNWQSKLTDQDLTARFLVLYTASATDASATVVDRAELDLPFVAESKTYWCGCKTEKEAHYVSAYINSGYANSLIKDFQSLGLFGPRDIHKLIVKVPFPAFRKGMADHEDLSALGRECAELASTFVKRGRLSDLEPRALGAARARLRDQLAFKLDAIDAVVEKLSTGGVPTVRSAGRRRRRATTGLLL